MKTHFTDRILSQLNPLVKDCNFSVGDTVGVYIKIKEGEKERVQQFKGVVLKIQGRGRNCTFTVRKMSSGIGVEKTIPLCSPNVDKVTVYSQAQVRRSRLYYLRNLKGKAARLKSELFSEKDSLKKQDSLKTQAVKEDSLKEDNSKNPKEDNSK